MNEIIISNVTPQDITIGEGGATGITAVYVNGVDVTQGSAAYVIVPTKTSELINNSGFITSEEDPTVPYYIKEITRSDINRWNSKQDELVSGQNIKTINNQSILGNGNLDVETEYTAGTGIQISDENVINNTITSYNDLSDLPTIPTSTSQLTNDSDFVSSSALSEVAFTGEYNDLLNTPDLSEYITKYVSDLVNYYNKDFFFKILPKVSGSGTSITLNDTIKGSQMYLTLGATELSQDGTPTPDSPQEIHSIKGSNTISIYGKNLLNLELGEILSSDGSDISATTVCRSKNYIPIEYNQSVIASGTINGMPNIRLYDSNKNYIGYAFIPSTGIFTNTNTQAKYFRIRYPLGNYTFEQIKNTLMMEYGETASTFTPYVSQTADVDLGDIEYCKIGTYEDVFFKNVESSPYYDENLDEDTWYLKQEIGKVVLDGSGSFSMPSANRFNIDGLITNYLKSNNNTTYLCNKYIAYEQKSTNGDFNNLVANVDYGLDFSSGSSYTIRIKDTRFTSIDDFKTALAIELPEIPYVLDTPTYTPITGTLAEQLEYVYQMLKSYKGVTNISQVNDDLPFTISATTLKDLSNL